MRRLAVLTVVLACALAAPALAAPVHVLDPEDTPYGAPDVLDLVVDSNDAGELGVVTRFVPRPPAGWGVCVPFVPNSPTCFPPDMRVDWFFDFAPGAGAPSEGGADARVTAVPGAGTTTMELSRWAGARGWVTGAPPAFRTAPADPYLDLGWGTTLAELGIAPGTEVAMLAAASYKSFSGLGLGTSYLDRAPDTGVVRFTAAGAPAAPSARCRAAAAAYRRARAARRRASTAKARRRAQRTVRRRRAQLRRACGAS